MGGEAAVGRHNIPGCKTGTSRLAKVCSTTEWEAMTAAMMASTVTTWSSVTTQVLALHLIAEQVTLVVLEATGDYWKPLYYLLEDVTLEPLTRAW